MKELSLNGTWHIKAPLSKVLEIMTDFEKFPEYFPSVAESIKILKREGNNLEILAIVKSFGGSFPVQMMTQIIPRKGYISDNENPKMGISGHEEFLLSEDQSGTVIDYTYKLSIHRKWLRIVALPLLKWYSMKHWEKAVIEQLRTLLASKS